MLSPIKNALLFLIQMVFDLYLLVLMVRLILFWSKSNYFNPITQTVIKLTQRIINPLRRIIPNYKNLETATLVTIFIIESIKYFLLGLIAYGVQNSVGIFFLAFIEMIKLLLNTFFYAILLQAILSWVNAGYSPLGEVLAQITSPIMRPLRRLIPPVGGFDISPIPALIGLQLLLILLSF